MKGSEIKFDGPIKVPVLEKGPEQTMKFLDKINDTVVDIILLSRDKETPSEDTISPVTQNSLSSLSSLSSDEDSERFEAAITGFTKSLNNGIMKRHSDLLVEDFKEALQQNSRMSMLPNHNILPTGREHGNYLAIDLGGSTLRVALIMIDPSLACENNFNRIHTLVEKKWLVDNNFKVMDYDFIRWIGAKVSETLNSQTLLAPRNNTINVGVTWSFPLEMVSHNSGKIVHVSKGYEVSPEIFQKDLKMLLETVLANDFDISIDVKAIINDSLAVYAAGTFYDSYTKLAIVLGTGLNLCYSLPTAEIPPQKSLGKESALYNVELSLFGQHLLEDFSTKYDLLIDNRFSLVDSFHFKSYMTTDPISQSIFQPSELMTSGRYLPELTRLVLIDMIDAGELFKDIKNLKRLYEPYDGLTGRMLCYIDENNSFSSIKQILHEEYNWPLEQISVLDIVKLKDLVNSVIQRAAFIVATMIVSSIKLIKYHNKNENYDHVMVSSVGSVLEYFNRYRNLITEWINKNEDIVDMGLTVEFMHIENSSIVGAAVAAAYYL
ncbi:uncharacterized protein PRCAT00001531001 [Priceomyces carsonii]|uniref:uncharacterized protein n=1 Tax=Priceomyces carsonii TaxID=28549 RepID=UPI002EDB5BF1|nr:unnamed protein product [Priceomyces carsonii]